MISQNKLEIQEASIALDEIHGYLSALKDCEEEVPNEEEEPEDKVSSKQNMRNLKKALKSLQDSIDSLNLIQ